MRIGTVVVMLAMAARVAAAQGISVDLKVDGNERHALVFPPTARSAAAPVVLAFHGAGDTAENFSGVGLHRAMPEAVTVYMAGMSRQPGQGGTFQTTDGGSGNRDLRFVDAMLTEVGRRYDIDRRRVFATGFSNGAKLVYLLWATRAEAFAAFAPVAGMLTAPVAISVPRPVLHIGGREDRQNDFQLQLASIELARRANGTKARVVTYLHSGGHVYPEDATQRIVDFFRNHN